MDALLTLAEETGEPEYRDAAQQTLEAFSGSMHRFPGAFVHMIASLSRYLSVDANASMPSPPIRGDGLVRVLASASRERVGPGETFRITAHVRVDDGWHINAHPASFDYLIPTTLEVTSELPIEALSISYPEALEARFAFAEDTLRVYQGEMRIEATLRLGPDARVGRRGRVTLTVRYQACDDARCLPPTSTTSSVDVEVAA